MSPKICRNLVAITALAVTLSASPALAAGPKLRNVRPESPWQAIAGFWSAAVEQVASWWKQAPPSQQNQSCHNNGNVSCSFKPPGAPGDVGSAIDPDGRP
jgi:hypothetical protein